MAAKAEAGRFSPIWMRFMRVFLLAAVLAAFIPNINPARTSGMISQNVSLFTCAISYSAIGENFVRALNQGWVERYPLTLAYTGSAVMGIGIVLLGAAFCMSLGNLALQRFGAFWMLMSSVPGLIGASNLFLAYNGFTRAVRVDRIDPILPMGLWVFTALFIAAAVFAAVTLLIALPKAAPEMKFEIAVKYKLFLMILPFLVLVTLFSYLPLVSWRYAFFDYRAGFAVTMDDFAGFKWFRYLFENASTRRDIVRVLRNTFVMSGIGIATAWLPMVFAIFLSEIRRTPFKRTVQTFTTIPHFISWVLVYSVAFAIFSREGFLNWMLVSLGFIDDGPNYLMSGNYIWIKMWAWGTWKGLGWGAIIYLAGIAGIDQELYEAATVDGAGRFARMWYITVPGLLSTFFVLLLLGIANILSNGMEQYLVFDNANNRSTIQVLDLYIYQLGLTSSSPNIPLATVVGMFKSVVSVTLLFAANRASKFLRGESIV
jgi:putative aldouronate transport system permease protein